VRRPSQDVLAVLFREVRRKYRDATQMKTTITHTFTLLKMLWQGEGDEAMANVF